MACRVSGRGGTTLPGKVLLALSPGALRPLAARHESVICVSATNGKTTLTAMLATMCEQAGVRIAHNMAGANLRSGVATALLTSPTRAQVALLEVDEGALPQVAADTRPSVLVLANLFRDQLDRYGELETIARRWLECLVNLPAERTTVVYNVDDPLIADLVLVATERHAERGVSLRTLGFGCEDRSVAAPHLPHAADAKFCRRCYHAYEYEASFVGHLGHYHCPNCGATRPEPDVRASALTLDGLAASKLELQTPQGVIRARLRIPGLYNAYNALGATAAATAMGLSLKAIEAGLAAFSPAFGRFERIPVPFANGDRTGSLTLLLVKNPIGLNEVARTLVDAGVDLTATLFALNDGIADGRDTSWIWDADIEGLLQQAPALVVTGDRAAEFALRASYAGIERERLLVQPDLEDALDLVLERADTLTTHRHAYALVTYTALLKIRGIVSRRGWADDYWNAPGMPRSPLKPVQRSRKWLVKR